MARYKIISCHVLWREICHLAAQSSHVFDFQFLKQGLHDTPGQLQKELQAAINSADGNYAALLIGYGLCSNGIAGIRAGKTRLVVVRAHDCITHLLGSRQRYREYFDQHPGTYWYSPGWIDTGGQPGKERYERIFQTYVEKYGKKNAQYLMEMEQGWFKSYSNAAYVDLGFGPSDQNRQYTQQCAQWLNWRYEELKGDPGLLQRFLAGDWNPADFLIVEPGQQIVASYDESVIRAVEATPPGTSPQAEPPIRATDTPAVKPHESV